MEALPGRIHFLGIAGIGVSALARMALARGVRVSGSDPHAFPETNPAIQRLLQAGALISTQHLETNLTPDVELVVASAAVPDTNPEIQEAHRRGVRVISRADFLGELMDAHRGVKIAVAGTHGKTTTTAMIGVMLQEAGLDPTVFVGGETPQLGGNVRIGADTGPLVVEACEAYDSFHSLSPDIAVVTNVEADHLDHYAGLEAIQSSFRRFLGNIRPPGYIVACMDDPGARSVVAGIDADVAGYGVEWGIDLGSGPVRPERIALEREASFDLSFRHQIVHFKLGMPGRHNISNALAAILVGLHLGVEERAIATGLARLHGVTRRQEILGEVALGTGGSILVMDDYAHHPTEISSTLQALRGAYPARRLIAVFQPHLYSRTRDFLPEFAAALAAADALIVTEIYAAREAPIAGVLAAEIVNRAVEINSHLPAVFLPNRGDVPAILQGMTRSGDLVVFLGAGDIREQGERFLQRLREEAGR